MRKGLLIISIVLISLFVIGAVSASDDADNLTAVSDDNEVAAIDNDLVEDANDVLTADVNEKLSENVDDVLSDDATEILSAGEIDPQIDFNVTDVKYDEDATINVSVVDKNNASTSFNNSIVSVFLDETFLQNLTLNENGKASYLIPAGTYGVGTYHIVAKLNNTFARTMLTISKATPIVNVDTIEAVTGTIIKIPFNVTDSKGKGIDGDVIVTIHWSDDVISHHVKVVNGKANVTFDISDLLGIFGGSGGGFNFTASFGNGTNRSSFNFTALGGNGTFNFTALFGGNGTNSTFNITALFGENGTFNISSFTGGNGTFNISSLLNGTGGFNFTDMFNFNKSVKFAYVLDVGTYNLTVTYLDSRNYVETSNDTAKLIITYADDVVYACQIDTPEKYGDDTKVAIALVDKYGNPIVNQTVSITLNGKSKGNPKLNENGTLDFTIAKLENGDYELVIAFNGTNATYNFTVSVPMKTTLTTKNISILAVNTKVDGKAGKYLSATLKDSLGHVLASKKVKIAINGKINTIATDSKGVVKLQINIAKAGTYTASICYLGDDDYYSSFTIAKVTIKKQTPKLTAKKAKYKAKAKTKKLKATFKSSKGKALKNKKIRFTVKGKTYTGTTNAKGVATVKVKITKKGNHKVTVKFAGDNTYKAVTKKTKLIIK